MIRFNVLVYAELFYLHVAFFLNHVRLFVFLMN